jgi:hypothetical protein
LLLNAPSYAPELRRRKGAVWFQQTARVNCASNCVYTLLAHQVIEEADDAVVIAGSAAITWATLPA